MIASTKAAEVLWRVGKRQIRNISSTNTTTPTFSAMFVEPALSRTVLAHTSTYNLALSSFVFNVCNQRKIIDPVIRFLRASESQTSGLTKRAVTLLTRHTVFPHFTAGESMESLHRVSSLMEESKVKLLVDHSVEEREREEDWDENVSNKVQLLRNCKATMASQVGFVPVKATAMVSPTLLEIMTSIILEESKLGEHHYADKEICPRNKMISHDLELLESALKNLSIVCQEAQALQLPILLDAEQSHRQPAIDYLCRRLQREFNVKSPIIYNTYQMYMTCSGRRVERDLKDSVRHGYKLAAKVVRGAYLVSEKERSDANNTIYPLWEDKACTDVSYDDSVETLVRSVADGSGASLLIATHNLSSVQKAIVVMQECGVEKGSAQVAFAQIMGMCDVLTLALGAYGCNTHKLVLYGDFDDLFPWLLRRLDENRDMLGAAQLELPIIQGELKRRVFSVLRGIQQH